MGVCMSSKTNKSNCVKIKDNVNFNNEYVSITKESLKDFKFFNRILRDDSIKTVTDYNNLETNNWAKIIINNYEKLSFKISSSSTTTSFTNSNTNIKKSKHEKQFNLNYTDNLSKIIDLLCEDNEAEFRINLAKGCPSNLRWLIWMSIAKTKYGECYQNNNQAYSDLLAKKLPEKQTDQINKDLHRTSYAKYFQKESGSKSLFNVLKALALFDKSVGYCQGMNIIVANFLLVSDGNEQEVFFLMRYLLYYEKGLNLKNFFTHGFPAVHELIYTIKELIRLNYMNIYRKLEEFEIPDEIWIFKWIQSIFALTLDFSVGIRFWDVLLSCEDYNFLIKYSLAYINQFQDKILLTDDISEFVELMKSTINNNSSIHEILKYREKLIEIANSINLNKTVMENIKNEYKNTIKNNYVDEGSFYKEVNESEVMSVKAKIKQNIDNFKYKESNHQNISGLAEQNNVIITFENLDYIKGNKHNFCNNNNSIGKEFNYQNTIELQEEDVILANNDNFKPQIIVAKF